MPIDHNTYRDTNFTNRFITHADLQAKINALTADGIFKVRQAGLSAQGRTIYHLSIGTGKTDILLWSQMHGDESTATLALLDLFNFFSADDEHNGIRKQILDNCTLHFIPMLNPDGAEMFTRRNAQGIDINRDFLAEQSPEGRILKQIQQQLQPEFGFNLHDQGPLWSVTGSRKPAPIALLAPPADDRASVTPSRLKAIKVVTAINNFLQEQIPGQIGRWDDTFEPRAFGDNFQRLGMATVLIEAGGYAGDPERQFVRKLNFDGILFALRQIASGDYQNQSTDDYYRIPQNNKEIFHILIRNCQLQTPGGVISADIGLNYSEQLDLPNQTSMLIYSIADIGDLSTWGAYEYIDASGALVSGTLAIDYRADFTLKSPAGTPICFENGIIVYKNN
ncbi:peptidase M14 [Mucilaginibacter sp. PPCGB 2223]|uniref:M14 family zinc carboxypeptidase n=1 Tax=Mucilaginibacter sp. PPCGB 2223 TaxID=1886027 RepID=UPI000825EB84|nr:M14 family zinc carboxypeptidase [Mucilaginibacter sp. PPCGB 2223]OCX51376.1 peptidase M14 [Mucilaginibacter sp. PPCGB 2223]